MHSIGGEDLNSLWCRVREKGRRPASEIGLMCVVSGKPKKLEGENAVFANGTELLLTVRDPNDGNIVLRSALIDNRACRRPSRHHRWG